MSDNDYDDEGNHRDMMEKASKRARFEPNTYYHDVIDGSKISHFCVQNDIFCIISAASVTSSAELYIRDTPSDSLRRLPLPCAVSGLYQDIGTGQHVFVTSTAGDLFYVHVPTKGVPCRVITGGPGAPLINDVCFLDSSVLPASTEPGVIKVLLALKSGQIGLVSFDAATATKMAQLPGVSITVQGPPLGRGVPATSVEAICHNAGVIVLATTPLALYCYNGPDAVAATQQAPRTIATASATGAQGSGGAAGSSSSSFSAASNAAAAAAQFEPSQGRPLHLVRSYSDSIPTAFIWANHTAIVHGFFDKEQRGRVVFTQKIGFPFMKDLRMRASGFGAGSGGGGFGAGGGSGGQPEGGMGHGDRAPIQVVSTAFHMLLRYESRVAILKVPPGLPWRPRLDPAAAEARRIMEKSTRVGETFAEFDWSDRYVTELSRRNTRILGIVRDVANRRIYAYSDQHVWNIGVHNERAEIWRLFFERATDKEESWEHRVRFYNAAAALVPKNSPERNLIYFHLGRAAFQMTRPGRLLVVQTGAADGGGKGGGNAAAVAGGGGGPQASPLQQAAGTGGLSWNTTGEYEEIAVKAFSACTMFDEIVLLLRGSSSLLSRYIEKRLEVLSSGTGSQAGGAQQLVLLVTFALLLRLEPKIDTAIMSRAAAHAQQQLQQQQQQPSSSLAAAGGAANRSANIAALNKLVDDLKSRPKLVHLLADDYFYNVVTRLLESLGHLEKSVDLAIATSRFRHAVSHHCQMREYQEAASVLVEHCCNKGEYVELWYDFAGQIVTRCRKEVFAGFRKIVNAKLRPDEVDFRRFIPAFIAYDESQKEKPEDNEIGHRVVSLLSLVIFLAKSGGGGGGGGGNGLPRVLNDYFLSVLFYQLVLKKREVAERLLMKKGSSSAGAEGGDSDEEQNPVELIEGQIDEVLGSEHDESAIDTLPDVTLEYALRRCVEFGHIELSIRLYRLLQMPEQALTASLRLENGLERAQCFLEELASNPDSNNERTMKSLWMLLTQLVLADPRTRAKRDSTEDTRIVLSLIQRSNGVLRLEEVIVLLEAQEALQDFRRAVCDSLNSYTAKIKALTEQMSQATKLAETLRTDLANLEHQYGYVTAAQRCSYCKTPLLKSRHDPFVVFPTCRHAFHYSCGKQMFSDKDSDLIRSCCHSAEIDSRAKDGIALWQRLLEAECPYCGEWAIMSVTRDLGDDVA